MSREDVREIECPNSHAVRAVFPDDPEPLRCYSCEATLDRANARAPQPATRVTTLAKAKWSPVKTAVLIVIGAVMAYFLAIGIRNSYLDNKRQLTAMLVERCQWGTADEVQKLIQRGGEVNGEYQGSTPLEAAMFVGRGRPK